MKKRIFIILLSLCMMFAITAFATVQNAAEAASENVLRVALPSLSPFSGLFNPLFNSLSADADVYFWMVEPLLLIGEDLMYNQDGAATYTYDRDAQTITLTMKPGVKWHDGTPVTMEDLVFAHEVLGHPEYDGYFYRDSLACITGMTDYHAGNADSISGFILSEDKNTLTIHFDDFKPSILEGGLWQFPLPKHYMKHIPVSEMAEHERSRSQFIGFGPFMISNIVPGETAELVRFDDYWQGRPMLDGVIITIVNPDLLPSAMERGIYDVSFFPSEHYADYMNPVNFEYLTIQDRYYQVTGFRMGHFDFEKGENIPDPNAKMSNVNLRRAMGYALDIESINNDFYNGLTEYNPMPLPPAYAIYLNPDITGYMFDPDKAKTLLDEAGYIDADGDGFRENPDGSSLIINYAISNLVPETVVQFTLQCWRDIGLDVRLYTGNLLDNNAFFGMLFNDDQDIDLYTMGFFIEESPNFANIWGRYSIVNFTRYASEELDALIAALDSWDAWDIDYRVRAYHEFMAYFFEQSFAIPTLSRTSLYAVNKRVMNFRPGMEFYELSKYLIKIK